MPAWYEDVDLCARLGREGTILYLPDARFRHRGGESASRLGYARFLPIFYRNALRYRARALRARRRAPATALLLAKGMVLRLAAAPVAPRRPAPALARRPAPTSRCSRLALGPVDVA